MQDERIINFQDYISTTTRDFTGRDWLRAEIQSFLSQTGQNFFILTGEPGVGKTAFLAHLVDQDRPVHHFVSDKGVAWDSAGAFVDSIGAQLGQRYGPEILAEKEVPAELRSEQHIDSIAPGGTVIGFYIANYQGLPVKEKANRLIVRSLRRLAERGEKSIILVVDALDECARAGDEPTITDLLVGLQELPNLRLVVSVHRGSTLADLRDRLPSKRALFFEIAEKAPEHRADIHRFLEQAADRPQVQTALSAAHLTKDEFVRLLDEASDGNFLYAVTVLSAIQNDPGAIDMTRLPASLASYYRMQIGRYRREAEAIERGIWKRQYQPVLGALSVARAGLSETNLAHLSGLRLGEVVEVLDTLALFLESRNGTGEAAHRWYHHALPDFITDRASSGELWLDPAAYHEQVANRLHARFPDLGKINIKDSLAGYALQFLAYHDRQAGPGHFPRLYAAIDPAVRRAKLSYFGSDEIFQADLAEVISAALAEGPLDGFAQLARAGLIDATLRSKMSGVSPDLLRELARSGSWARAVGLARVSSGGQAAGMEAIVEGLLLRGGEGDLAMAAQVANEMPDEVSAAPHRPAALARVAAGMAQVDPPRAAEWFEEAARLVEESPDLDQQARLLAKIGRLRAASEPVKAAELFDRALERARKMGENLPDRLFDELGASNMMAQSVQKADYVLSRTPFDTLGAKARVLADVAADMNAVGDRRAEAIFTEAEHIASQISHSAAGAIFIEHSAEYIRSRLKSVLGPPLALSPAELEKQLIATEAIQRDERGLLAFVYLKLAEELIQIGKTKQARQLLDKVETAVSESDLGFRADRLLVAARLWQKIGEKSKAQHCEEKALEWADETTDFPSTYRAWLAKRGRTEAIDLRELATSRAMITKGSYTSDKVRAEMVISLARDDLEGATNLAARIHDPLQAVRAYAALAGYYSHQDPQEARSWLERMQDRVNNIAKNQRGYAWEQAAVILAGLNLNLARQVIAEIQNPGDQALAYLDLAASVGPGSGELAADLHESAWQVAHQAAKANQHPGFALCASLARLGEIWSAGSDERGSNAFDLAVQVARRLPAPSNQSDALCEIANRMREPDPERALTVLQEVEASASRINDAPARGVKLSQAAGVRMYLDPTGACQVMAELRRLGRSHFLDVLAQVIPGAAQLGGEDLLVDLVQAVDDAEAFFR